MSVIQALREKYATTVVIVVCISLVAFLLMDALVGPKSFFNKDMDVVSVNGTEYSYQDYMQDIKKAENNYRQQHPDERMNDQVRNQIKEQVYQRFIQQQLLQGEYDQLGIAFSSEELRSLTITDDADPRIKQIPGFQNPETGQFDPNRVINFINSVKNAPVNNQQALMQRQQWMQMEDMLRNTSLVTKFTSLVNNGIYIPSWLSKMKLQEQNQFSDISFVSSPYSAVPDSVINITESDLKQYLEKHKNQFQVEPSRSIEYISFDAVPSSKDSSRIFDRISSLKAELDTLDNEDVAGFISRSSETPFVDRYIPESMIESSVKSDLINLSTGAIYGPYFDDGDVVYAKNLGCKNVYDSIEIQQLLISTQANADSSAQFTADSIKNVVNNGADFANIINEFTQGQAPNDGILTITPDNENIPDDFVQFGNNHHVGYVGVVESQYGYHVIKIKKKSQLEKGYKIAYLSAAMSPSQTTENKIYSEANKFRGLNGTRDKFENSAKEQNISIQKASDLSGDSYKINNLSSSRDIIHWAFNADKNDVSKVFVLPNSYVIAVLTGVTEKGTAPLASVKQQIQAVVRRHKKAEYIAGNIKGESLNTISSAIGDSVSQSTDINFSTSFIPNSGFEPKVVGASFNKEWKGDVSSPIFGENGVYYLKIDSLNTTNVTDSTAILRVSQQMENLVKRQVGSQLRNVLEKQADITDRRFSFPGL